MTTIKSEPDLIALSSVLAGLSWSITAPEQQLVDAIEQWPSPSLVAEVRARIGAGEDPLGEAFCRLRSAGTRREAGAVYTPAPIIRAMVEWASSEGDPARIVDPGAGSGRFILAAARRFPRARLIAVETDPLATLMLRANATVLGVTDRLAIELADYRLVDLPEIDGPTLFIGNPPYVRHHDIPEEWKTWFADTAAVYGFKASKLAGLHIHFFMKTRELARPDDFGAFVTSAEWLDVNYGSTLRKLLADGLGGIGLHVLAPESMPFEGTATTGAITCFRIGGRPAGLAVQTVERLDQLKELVAERTIPWSRLEVAPRWSILIRPSAKPPSGAIELGELCRVHRGQVTGGNRIWIAGGYAGTLPASVLVPTITRAREIFAAGHVLRSDDRLRRVIDLPVDLDLLAPEEREHVDRFLAWAQWQGANQSYIARNRRAWWAVGLKAPAPIICTYMARQPPAFVRNLCEARHLNIAHGLYPRELLPERLLTLLTAWLNTHVRIDAGRTYAGGLTKFEPKEVERILIPRLEDMHDIAAEVDSSAAKGLCRGSEGNIPAGAP